MLITGSAHLISLIEGVHSTFNVAKFLYMIDFSEKESERLIDGPFERLKIKISEQAKGKLISQTSGHPQLLQHACYNLVENGARQNLILILPKPFI